MLLQIQPTLPIFNTPSNGLADDILTYICVQSQMKFTTLFISVLIIIAVLIPGSKLPDVSIGGYDKVIHIAMFIAWALAVRFDYNRQPFRYALVFLIGMIFSALTEALQILVEGRSFDIYDMAADAFGLIIGLAISGPVMKWVDQLRA